MTKLQNLELAEIIQIVFADLPDPRAINKIHPLINIVVIALVATIAGANDFEEIHKFGITREQWFSTFLDLQEGIPSQDTFARVFSLLDPMMWSSCVFTWVRFHINGTLGKDFIALDGKCLRGSSTDEHNALYMVNAWASQHGLAIAQVPVIAKSNEITALPPLLETISLLDLEGCIVTTDAMGTQREIARIITENKAMYLLALKDNQPTIAEDVRWLFEINRITNFKQVQHDYYVTTEKGHGRIEERHCWVMSGLDYLKTGAWSGLNAVALIESKRVVKGVESIEQRYYLSSVGCDAKTTLEGVRAHWGVENKVHWVLDVVFREDAHRVRERIRARNLAVLRQFALNLLRSAPDLGRKTSLKIKRKQAGWDMDYLETILRQL
jgi:predicted transposase YbfD/YdcC